MSDPSQSDRPCPHHEHENQTIKELRAERDKLIGQSMAAGRLIGELEAERDRLAARVRELEQAPLNLPSAVEAKKAVAKAAELGRLLAQAQERVKAADTHIRYYANAVEQMAFKMPPPNEWTPQFVQLALMMRCILPQLATSPEGSPVPPNPGKSSHISKEGSQVSGVAASVEPGQSSLHPGKPDAQPTEAVSPYANPAVHRAVYLAKQFSDHLTSNGLEDGTFYGVGLVRESTPVPGGKCGRCERAHELLSRFVYVLTRRHLKSEEDELVAAACNELAGES